MLLRQPIQGKYCGKLIKQSVGLNERNDLWMAPNLSENKSVQVASNARECAVLK